jgi:hypothetical protein
MKGVFRMTAKRFYRNRGTIWENDKSMSLGEVEDKLNALYEENEQLKQQIHYLKIVCRNELDDETLKQVMGSLGSLGDVE